MWTCECWNLLSDMQRECPDKREASGSATQNIM
jgi:hypothetical protein